MTIFAIRNSLRVLLLLSLVVCLVPIIDAQERPLLSEEIRRVIESQGIEAAKKRFKEIYPAMEDQYQIDIQDLFNLGSEYMQTDLATGMAIMEMNSVIVQAQSLSLYQDALNNPQMAGFMKQAAEQQQLIEAQQKLDQNVEQEVQKEARVQQRGKSRDDLGRFSGIYVDPATNDQKRALWVMASCDGYLMSGATWGDASPWVLRSAAEKVFTYADSFQSFSLEFEIDNNASGGALHHDLNLLPSPLEKSGPTPPEWGKCLDNRM